MLKDKKFKKVRLFKVSRELNVTVEMLAQHLQEIGYAEALTGTGLNAAITDEDAYLELLEAFADDKASAARVKEKRAARRAEQQAEANGTAEEPAGEEPAEDQAHAAATAAPTAEATAEETAEAPPADTPAPTEEASEPSSVAEETKKAAATTKDASVEASTEQAAPEQAAPEQAAPDQASAEQEATDQASAEQTAPDQKATDQVAAEPAQAEAPPAEPSAVKAEAAEQPAQGEPEGDAAKAPAPAAAPKTAAQEAQETPPATEPSGAEMAEKKAPESAKAPKAAEKAESKPQKADSAKAGKVDGEPAEGETAKDEAAAEKPAQAGEKAEGAEGENVLTADRYQLQGTKVIGKLDLSQIDDDDKKKRKRKRKRKKAASTDEGTVQIAETAKAATKKKRRKGKRGPQVDESEVEQTLQDTLRELEQGASRARQRRRRSRRARHEAEREERRAQEQERETFLRVTEFISTGELANLMDVGVNEVISTLFDAGMMVSINQRLDADTISYLADEFGFDLEFITEFGSDDIELEEDTPDELQPRAPIVTVMGHVDHGKTSLLDYIREANVVSGEAGGITQHIGAYKVDVRGDRGRITFLDTPGHEAFTAMRARGAKVTDVVILVVAADDAVMPQTIEAINHAKAAEVPIVVAVNKIDKPASNPQRVMQQLADHNVLVEQYGGKVQYALVSAKTGEGVDDLLDKVLLESELLELQANPERNANGIVIESRLEKGRGNVATVLVQNGSLRVGDTFVAGIFSGRVRAMFDERDQRVEMVGPAEPALILGFDGSPEVGDQFIVLDDEKEARDIAQRRQQIYREQKLRQRKHITLEEIGRRLALGDFQELNLIIKGDVGGSVEALADSLLKLSTEEVAVNIIHSGVGAITESDVMLASASDAVIIGFQVRPAPGTRVLAEREEIDIRMYSVIYNAIEEVRDALEGLLQPSQREVALGTAEVREIFKVPRVGTVAGCYVVEGKIRRNDKIRVIRDGVVIYDGGLASLKRFKEDVREVTSGYECGMGVENFNDIKVSDHLEAYEIIEEKRKLEV